MNNILQDAYQPYFEDSEAFLQQATVMSEYIDQGNLRAARETNSILEELSEVMTASENQFQSVLDERIEHENSLIKSRVTRSIIIVWSMATLFIMSAAAGFWTFIKTIITPLKKANNSLGDIIEKLDSKLLYIIRNYNILNEVAYVSTGDIGLVIAARKFYELSNLISNANYSIKQAEKSDDR